MLEISTAIASCTAQAGKSSLSAAKYCIISELPWSDVTSQKERVLFDAAPGWDQHVKNLTGDVFGRIYEYFLMKFSMSGAGAQEGGEFSPRLRWCS